MTKDFIEFLYSEGRRLSRQATEISKSLQYIHILANKNEASKEVEYAIKYCETSLRVFLLRIRDLEQIAVRNKQKLAKQTDKEKRKE